MGLIQLRQEMTPEFSFSVNIFCSNEMHLIHYASPTGLILEDHLSEVSEGDSIYKALAQMGQDTPACIKYWDAYTKRSLYFNLTSNELIVIASREQRFFGNS